MWKDNLGLRTFWTVFFTLSWLFTSFYPGDPNLHISFLEGLAAGFLGGFGSLVGGMAQASAQREINEQQIGFAREQMGFQERMSNSAYQRAMADMKKAGLNPMLAFSQGGASTPPGSQPTLAAPDEGAKFRSLAEGMSTAMEVGRFKKEMEVQDSVKKVNEQTAREKDSNIALNKETMNQIEATTKGLRIANLGSAARLPLAKKQAESDLKRVEIDNTKSAAWLDKVAEKLRNFFPLKLK